MTRSRVWRVRGSKGGERHRYKFPLHIQQCYGLHRMMRGIASCLVEMTRVLEMDMRLIVDACGRMDIVACWNFVDSFPFALWTNDHSTGSCN